MKRQRYFVFHLNEKDDPKPRPGAEFEIQILDSKGRAKLLGYIGKTETELDVEGHRVPRSVLEAARRQPIGEGDYVDETGQSIPPF